MVCLELRGHRHGSQDIHGMNLKSGTIFHFGKNTGPNCISFQQAGPQWLKGYWRVVWQNETVRVGAIDTEKQTVTLAVPVSHGIGCKYHRPDGSGEEIYWVMNLLEAVDQPGEWAIDFQDQKLLFNPPGPIALEHVPQIAICMP